MIEVIELPNSFCIHIKSARQMLYCASISNQYIVLRTIDSEKEEVQLILFLFDACFLSK